MFMRVVQYDLHMYTILYIYTHPSRLRGLEPSIQACVSLFELRCRGNRVGFVKVWGLLYVAPF